MILEVRNAHNKGQKYSGINVFEGKIKDMIKMRVVEPLRVNLQEVQAASEAAMMILRIDDVIASKGGGGLSDRMCGRCPDGDMADPD